MPDGGAAGAHAPEPDMGTARSTAAGHIVVPPQRGRAVRTSPPAGRKQDPRVYQKKYASHPDQHSRWKTKE